jgi:hypothetical protein
MTNMYNFYDKLSLRKRNWVIINTYYYIVSLGQLELLSVATDSKLSIPNFVIASKILTTIGGFRNPTICFNFGDLSHSLSL